MKYEQKFFLDSDDDSYDNPKFEQSNLIKKLSNKNFYFFQNQKTKCII